MKSHDISCPTCLNTRNLTEATPKQTWTKLKSLLRENAHPSTSPNSHIPQLLSRTEQDVARCETEISRLQDIVFQLEVKKKSLASQVNGYRSLMSPIRTLPADVLREIFLCVCSENSLDITPKPEDCTYRLPALALAQVCTLWSTIVSSSPVLWSNISIQTTGYLKMSRATELVLRFLLRKSGSGLLSIRYENNGDREDIQDAGHFAELHLLAESSAARWSQLDLNGFPDTAASPHFVTFSNQLKQLEVLSLNLGVDEPVSLGDLPRLRTVAVSTILPSKMVINWSIVESISTLQYSPARSILYCLSRCTNLLDADVFCNEGRELTTVPPGEPTAEFAVTPASKIILRIEGEGAEAKTLLKGLTMPSLSDLHLGCVPPIPNPAPRVRDALLEGLVVPVPEILSFISRSPCITRFTLKDVVVSPSEWTTILRLMPHLIHLALDEPVYDDKRILDKTSISDDFFVGLLSHLSLSVEKSNHSFLPNLSYLKLGVPGHSFSHQLALDAIKSRCLISSNTGVVAMRSVHIALRHEIFSPECVPPLRRLSEQGVVYISLMDMTGWIL